MCFSRFGNIILPVACLTFILFACNGPVHRPGSKDSTGISTAETSLTDRAALVRELQAMHARLASKDKNKIGKLFTFPIPDSLISLSLSDSSFDEEWKRVGGLSESAFSTWFDEISEEWEFDKFNKIFTYLDVTKLLHKNKLEHKEIVNTEPCYGTYSIEIKDSLVSITCGSNTNDKYKGDLNPEEVTRCEYWVFWTFVFDGRKLRFVRQTAAG